MSAKQIKIPRVKIPQPVSGGLMLSYKCSAQCRHCMYACSPKWKGDWIEINDLEKGLSDLAPGIMPSPWGKNTISLNHGLHFTGGEPFLNFELLMKAVEIAEDFQGLFQFAKGYGYQESEEGYLSKCDLCLDIRKFIVDKGNFKELAPKEFYEHVG